MEETTTTEAPASTGAIEAQPNAGVGVSAATQPTESTTTTEESQAVSSDDNLSWLRNKGIDPSDPEAVAKVAKMYRDAERTMHQSTQKASELESVLRTQGDVAVTSANAQGDPVAALAAEVQALKMEQTVTAFMAATPDAKEYEPKMAALVNENPTMGELVRAGYLTVQQLYHIAKGSDSGRDDSLKTEGGREALQRVADKQQGKAVHGQATNSDFSSEQKTDPFRDALLGKI